MVGSHVPVCSQRLYAALNLFALKMVPKLIITESSNESLAFTLSSLPEAILALRLSQPMNMYKQSRCQIFSTITLFDVSISSMASEHLAFQVIQ